MCVRSCTDFPSVLRPEINYFSCRVPRPRQLPFIHEWGISLVNKLRVTESKHRHSFAVIILLIIIISWHFIDVNNKCYNYCYIVIISQTDHIIFFPWLNLKHWCVCKWYFATKSDHIWAARNVFGNFKSLMSRNFYDFYTIFSIIL